MLLYLGIDTYRMVVLNDERQVIQFSNSRFFPTLWKNQLDVKHGYELKKVK